jgi:hypothetical protein
LLHLDEDGKKEVMMQLHRRIIGLALLIFFVVMLPGCTAGDPRFTPDTPAGFWQGLWHGMISVITFIISLFNHEVKVYEVDNNEGWYNFGFLLGVICVWGGSSLRAGWESNKRRERERQWQEVGEKVEQKVMRKLKDWAETEGEAEWEEIGKKVEEKLKRKIKEWAEED